ncbi:Electron transfer DM13 [Microbacterium oxydans]|uniref:Electron transfer DM13 n=1 Tax=Microbacterium oxydans TaxID=82380 RepID=A0A0F0KMZ6_9MICO|nr:DM13 domain-containing protein [Microbacterium oxydans]KJL22257.1 Electron transfer DM13 [Microbacterium oxydans]
MRKIAFAATAAVTLALALSACSSPAATEDTKPSSSASQSADSGASTTEMKMSEKTGTFMGLNEKKVSGTVTVSGDEVALSGFSSDEGPDLHVYLTNGTDEAAVSAGMLVDAVSFDTATQTFMLDGIDTSEYSYVVIHCDKAKAVFGAAELS